MHEVSNGKVSFSSSFSTNISKLITSYTLNITTNLPRLYCIKLAVKDVANNVKYARRFILFDNSSVIKTRQNKSIFYITSASKETHYKWQTHHEQTCITWNDYFYNDFYVQNQLLIPIEPDSEISGIYEQTSGLLPVKGTENVHGIVSFKISWKVNSESYSNEVRIPNIRQQLYCTKLAMRDGEKYTFKLIAEDIVNNSFIENRTFNVDRSAPVIEDIWLTKDGEEQIFVHDSTDLSKMKLSFKAFDPHSGLRSIKWSFGTDENQLASANIRVKTVEREQYSATNTTCYCPDVGQCEMKIYSFDLNRLVNNNTHIGDHNRNYFFTLTVENNARLKNIEHLDILVDDSPPESGAVYEGTVGGPDIDYTSKDNFIVRWNGFIDHESGIKLYRIGISAKCLNKEDFQSGNITLNKTDHFWALNTENYIRVQTNATGQLFATVVAINNALQSSLPVCSDGIIRDIIPPRIRNISFEHAKWSDSLFCLNGRAWHFNNKFQKRLLQDNTTCRERCSVDTSESELVDIMEELQSINDTQIDEFLCRYLPLFNEKIKLYLPNDHISLQWHIEKSLSQVDNFFVGFGKTVDEKYFPSLQTYKSTNSRHNFQVNHLGFGLANEFYVFIKAENKAKLEKIVSLGPLVIDETPPLYKKKPLISVVDQNIIISWDEGQFYDNEQTEKIGQILFQFVHGSETVSPILEWRYGDSEACEIIQDCISYPLQKLQKVDTEDGLSFAVDIYLYNNAGHVTLFQTDPFKLPSRYPPSHGVILDIDPAQTLSNKDASVHFTETQLCARWSGFNHHENVSLHIGVGTNRTLDNIYTFKPITGNVSFYCLKSDKFIYGTRFFVSIRAACSGGVIISSSNGVYIFNSSNLQTTDIQIGQREVPVNKCINSVNSSFTQFSLGKLTIGLLYKMHVETTSDNFTLKSSDASVIKDIHSKEFCLVPYMDIPIFQIYGENQTESCVRLIRAESEGFVKERHKIDVFIKNEIYLSTLMPKWTLLEHTINRQKGPNTSNSLHIQIIKNNDYEFTFKNISLIEKKQYSVGVRLCSPHSCSKMVESSIFEFERTISPGKNIISEFIVDDYDNNVIAHIEVQPYKAPSGIVLYQWILSESKEGNKGIISWRTFDTSNVSNISVKERFKLPVYPHSTFYICVRAYSLAGNKITTCTKPNRNSVGTDNINVVYDIDAAAGTWEKILNMIHSNHLGGETQFLHDTELNFGKRSSKVAGVVFYASERNISWYLMSTRRIPKFDQCQSDTKCITSLTSTNGYVYFERKYITMNNVYYICALSKPLKINRENYVESFAEIRTCSNGFILDDIPPSGGDVLVDNINGFINDLSAIEIDIEGFVDNIDASIFGYEDNIKYFSYAIGSTSLSNDFHNFTNVGKDRKIISQLDNIKDGSTLVVIVKATDYAGNSKTINSKEFVVDTSHPQKGFLIIDRIQKVPVYINSVHIDLYVTDFIDRESGVEFYEICLGTQQVACDIAVMRSFHGEHISYQLPQNINDGHVYVVSAMAVNRAGLKSDISTKQFISDLSPPTGGHVMDGHWTYKADKDFQQELRSIAGHWYGFADPHSGIQYYRVGLGTRPYLDNIESMVEVGLQTDMTWNGTFEPGKKYYVTVEVCNGANLCSSACSNGIQLDNIPPIIGIVRIGSGSKHVIYSPHNTSVHMQWEGFEDPQSGISHFENCIGTKPYICDISPLLSSLLQSNIIRTGLNLPIGVDLYVLVKAFNRAGINAKQTSERFIIDNSPPVVVRKPSIFPLGESRKSNSTNIQWEKSLIRVIWNFIDDESSIVKHIVSLKTHQNGHIPIENVVVGNSDTFLITLDKNNWLHDGDIYHVVVTCCNAAGLCTSSKSENLKIDSSPPLMGGFAYPMRWTNYHNSFNKSYSVICLSWYGFVDQDSPIDKYYVTVSNNFSGHELSNGIVVIDADISRNNHSSNITINQPISDKSYLIISIWAKNSAGLNSTIFRATVVPFLSEKTQYQSGALKFEKHSCKIHSCNLDCTCSAVGKVCTQSKMTNCVYVNSSTVGTTRYPKIEVFGGSENKPEQISSSSACLSGHWKVIGPNEISILRFEWSMGLFGQKPGDGIFISSERQWHDVGKRTKVNFCLPPNTGLIHAMKYTVYVKAWYSSLEQFTFSSDPIIIDHTPPQPAKGRFVLDSDLDCAVDYDVIDWMDKLTFCWKGVFRETQSQLSHFTISLGTSVNGSDIFNMTEVGLNTNFTLINTELSHGTRYYFTVTAYNVLGMQNSLSSDGFVIDMDTPVAGMVFNTDQLINSNYQSSTSSFGISWYGFIDHHSGIKSYHVAISEDNTLNQSHIIFKNVYLKTKYKFTKIKLEHGKRYVALVKACDAAGHASMIAKSALKSIDVTAPSVLQCEKYVLLRQNETYGDHMLEGSVPSDINIRLDTFLKKDNLYKISGILRRASFSSKLVLVIDRIRLVLYTSFDHNGSENFEYSFIAQQSGTANIQVQTEGIFFENHSLQANFYKCLTTNMKADGEIQFQQIGPSAVKVSTLIFDPESAVYKIHYGIGTSPGGLQLRPFSKLNNYQCVVDMHLEHGSKLYLTVFSKNHAGLTTSFKSNPIVVDKTPPVIRKLNVIVNDTHATDALYSVYANWHIEDAESGVKSCYCGLGRGLQMNGIESLEPTETNSACQFINMTLAKVERVYVKVMCINNVELMEELVSDPIIIRYTSTNVEFANVQVLSAIGFKQGIELFGMKFTEIYLQLNKSQVKFEWDGFEDINGIDHYEYRFLHNTKKEGTWKRVKKHTMYELDGLHLLPNEIYTIDVRAVNSENYTSELVSTNVFITGDDPKLTGNAMTVAWSNRTIRLDWSNVFQVPYVADVVYDVTVGSRRGYSDVIQLQRIENPNCSFSLPEFTTVSSTINEIVVFVTAEYSTGLSALYETNIKI